MSTHQQNRPKPSSKAPEPKHNEPEYVGELLELATAGQLRATPHRVRNRSCDAMRVSLPLFVNPPLDFVVRRLTDRESRGPLDDREHVHRVIAPGENRLPLHFGDAEWRRKGQNRWCWRCAEP